MHAQRPVAPRHLARVLVVDDSVVARTVIARVLEASGRFVIAGQAGSAAGALEFLQRERVDFILLDLAMPGLDGMTALPGLLAMAQGARVMIVSSSARDGGAASVRALALGAADTLEKPVASNLSGSFGRILVERLLRLWEATFDTATGERPGPPPAINTAMFDVVAIGASTGGIHALATVLRDLPESFRLPVMVTQHLPVAFMPYFTAQLAATARRPCDVATDRMRLRPGRIVVAPGDAHLRCVSLGNGAGAVRLTHERTTGGCLPSVDPMFASAAEAFGARTLAIVLSGMGRDGAEGAKSVREAGGYVVVQDEASSVVWGMPGAVVGDGLADAVLPPQAIGKLMVRGRRA